MSDLHGASRGVSYASRPHRPAPLGAAVNGLVALLAWAVFFYWWAVVATDVARVRVEYALWVLTLMAVGVFFVTLLWIRHNLRIASRGKRGFSTRYLVPVFENDYLNRPLEFRPATPRGERWVVVHADAERKVYESQCLMPFFSERDMQL